MDLTILYSIYFIGLILAVIELFIPGGIVGSIGAIMIISSIILTFIYCSFLHGLFLLGLTIIIFPALILWWLKKFTLKTAENAEDGYVSNDESLEKFLGKEGVTLTLLRPSGIVSIENKRIDAIADCDIIPANTPIKVVKIEGCRFVVRPINA